MTAIELKGLRKEFGDVVALDGVDLTVEEGEVFGFLGPNGAGKSTTINILLDFVRPTDGSATVLGKDSRAHSEAIRSRTGVLPEGYGLYDRLTARQHLEFVIDSKEADDDPMALLDRVGLDAEAADQKTGGFSKGMQQRLILAMALVGEPELLILDEPSTGLDPNGARLMREIVREENERGATVFFSSHILDQVESVCDTVGILQDGNLIAKDTIDGLREASSTGMQLVVTVGGSQSDIDTAVAAVEDITGTDTVSVEDGTLTVTCESDDKMTILNALESTPATVEDFETESASLGEVFTSYTTAAEVEQ